MIRFVIPIVSLLVLSLLSACHSNKAPAPVEVGHGTPGGTPYNLNLDNTDTSSEKASTNKPVKEEKEKEPQIEKEKPITGDPNRPEFVIVKEGETLYSIASQYKMSGAEVITINNLQAPYRVEIGQKLYLKKQPPVKGIGFSEPENIPVAAASEFIWPVQGRIITNYGENGNEGVNIAAPKNTAVFATQDGKVTYVGGDLEDFGNMVLITHDSNWRSAYAHLDRPSVQQGEDVKQGQIIGYVGQSGSVKSPQLHFELRQGANSVDPSKYLK